jgi:hypothetical protein
MDKGDHDTALANGGRDALHRAKPNVPAGEHARNAGLDKILVAACRSSRLASSEPEIPLGNPKFSIRDDVSAWPPGASCSTTIVRSPSEAPYTAAARPAGPVSYS